MARGHGHRGCPSAERCGDALKFPVGCRALACMALGKGEGLVSQ